jgi:hypothetical protein
LNGPKRILGKLQFKSNKVLTEISGFNELEYIGGNFEIYGNHADLMHIGGGGDNGGVFSNLKHIQGNLEMRLHKSLKLEYMDAFHELKSIGSSLIIRDLKSSNFTDFMTFPKLSIIQNHLRIVNSLVETIENSFPVLNFIGNKLEIFKNTELTLLNDFPNLNMIKGHFIIQDNDMLGQISGFDVLSHVFHDFTIANCNQLNSLTDFNAIVSVYGQILLQQLAITELNGWNGLEFAQGLTIQNCLELKSIHGFNSLYGLPQEIDRLKFETNVQLDDVDGFQALPDTYMS